MTEYVTAPELQAYLNILGKRVIPIVTEDNIIGSGVVIKLDEINYILTARHVIDSTRGKTLFFPRINRTVAVRNFDDLYYPIQINGLIVSNRHDIGLIRLTSDTIIDQHFYNEDILLTQNEFNNFAINEETSFIMVGFPGSGNTNIRDIFRIADARTIDHIINYIPANVRLNDIIRDENYEYQVEDGYTFHGPVMRFDYNYEEIRRGWNYTTGFGDNTHPAGFSGCGLWACNYRGPEVLFSPNDLKLISIQSSFSERNEHITTFPSHLIRNYRSWMQI